MIARTVALACVGAMLTAPAIAQAPLTIQQQSRCWLAGEGYSPGATIRAGAGVMVCGADFVWQATSDEAAGCLHDGNLFSVGAIENASKQQRALLQCKPDGTWQQSQN
jgi:hypothetical protein